MKREIKFRAWDGEKMHFAKMEGYTSGYGCFFNQFAKPVSIMQYTGLKDKNGKGIYEGDILSIDKSGIYEKGVAVIEWRGWVSNERWMLCKAGWFLKTKCKQIWTEKTIEIIGNIHQNPELLKQ